MLQTVYQYRMHIKLNVINLEDVDSILDCDRPDIFDN